jgi:hypothetical protein
MLVPAERWSSGFFEGFTTGTVDVGEAALHVRYGGTGSPVLVVQPELDAALLAFLRA